MVDFLFALVELFSLFITIPEFWGEMCTDRLFSQGVDLFAVKFYMDIVVPINHSWREKTRDTRLLDGGPHPSAFSHYDTIPESDGRTCHSIFSAVKMKTIHSFTYHAHFSTVLI